VVIREDYHKFVEKTEIFETLQTAIGNVIAVSYVIPVKHNMSYQTKMSVPAIYFSEKPDVVMFKLIYSEIISTLAGDEQIGISAINIDMNKLKIRLKAKHEF
jgi:hypothetical protein